MRLASSLGKFDELELEVHAIAREYRESFKRRLGLKEIPAIRLDDSLIYERDAVELAENLNSLLKKTYTTAEQAVSQPSDCLKRRIEEAKAVERAKAAPKVGEERDIYRAAIRERIMRLAALKREGRIDEETYTKLKSIYEELLKG